MGGDGELAGSNRGADLTHPRIALCPFVPLHSGVVTSIGEKIRIARERKGLSRAELAREVDLDEKLIARVETDSVKRSKGIPALCTFLGIDPVGPAPEPPRQLVIVSHDSGMETPVGEADFMQCIARIVDLHGQGAASAAGATVIPTPSKEFLDGQTTKISTGELRGHSDRPSTERS